MLRGILSLSTAAPPRSPEGTDVPSSSSSETDSEDAIFGAVSYFAPLDPSGP
jgi:hypothetical protein